MTNFKLEIKDTSIECSVNENVYKTPKLYFEDMTSLGFISQEKLFPFLTCLTACVGNDLSDAELLKCLYAATKDNFNREEWKELSNLVIKPEQLQINGKILDKAEWEKHWQKTGFMEFNVLIFLLIKGNLGNFSSLSTLLPQEWTKQIMSQVEKKLSILLTSLNSQIKNSK